VSERWGYAINQWKPNFDYFTRREQHERAFKTLSAAGFDAVELRAGTGRWEPLGRPERIVDNFGSAAGLVEFLGSCGIEHVASYFWDPGEANGEEPAPPRSPLEPADRDGIVASARIFAGFLNEVGGSCLVVRALPGRWRTGALLPEQLGAAGACWDAVGQMTEELGVKLALHVDFLSPLRSIDDLGALLDRTNAGLALDSAELAIAGMDPVAVAQRYGERVAHVHLKDARETVGDDAETANAEKHVLLGGGPRGIERWFWELGEGTVDVPGTVAALRERGYDGWWIVESDQSPAPPESALLNAWVARNVLAAR
jgi:inosose dehydratase